LNHALRAFVLIKKELPNAKMWVIGDGHMRKHLEKMNIKNVEFYRHMQNELKFEVLASAHVVFLSSVREGWGLVITELNAMGTPVIAHYAPGLRDSVIGGKTGILLRNKFPENLVSSAISLLTDVDTLNKYSTEALGHSKNLAGSTRQCHFIEQLENLLHVSMPNLISCMNKSADQRL
jgi:glycosyltransferase involved in cell wall biosynthesis